MPLKMQGLVQRGFTQMSDSLSPSDPRPFLLQDCFLADPANPHSDVVNRPGLKRTSATTMATAGTNLTGLSYEFIKLNGTVNLVQISGGKFYTVATTSAAPTETLTAAQLTAAGVTLTSGVAVYACTYNNQMVITDGVNTPWMWDGTAGGGITKLTNAPVAYGPPAVYYARIFFIMATDHGTMQWCEVNSANTGYLAGGFNNQWTLGQTGSEPLTALVGTNEGLYYFRQRSIGAVRGAVTATFSADGTHDAVAERIGCSASAVTEGAAPRYVADSIYFTDQAGRDWRIPHGGSLIPLSNALTRRLGGGGQSANKPFNLGENHTLNTPARFVSYAAEQIVLAIRRSESTALTIAIGYDALTNDVRILELWPGVEAQPAAVSASWTGGTGGVVMGSSAGVTMWRDSGAASQIYGVDQDGAVTTTAYSPTIIGPAHGYGELGEWVFDEIDVAFETNNADASALLKVDYLTDREHYSTLMAAQQQVAAYDASYQLKEQRARFGINGAGSWIRVRVQMSSTGRLACKGWTVKGFLVPLETVVVA